MSHATCNATQCMCCPSCTTTSCQAVAEMHCASTPMRQRRKKTCLDDAKSREPGHVQHCGGSAVAGVAHQPASYKGYRLADASASLQPSCPTCAMARTRLHNCGDHAPTHMSFCLTWLCGMPDTAHPSPPGFLPRTPYAYTHA